MSKTIAFNNSDYQEILRQAVAEIRGARTLIAKQVNSTTNSVYWNLGKLLFERQLEEGYGGSVVKQLSIDLKEEFPDMGLSPRNLWHMKRFYERYYQSDTKLQRCVAVLPWRHNLLLVEKTLADEEVQFYANEVLTKGWTRDLLLNAIKMDTYARAKNQLKTHNFDNTLPEASAGYANEVFKSSYNLGFLGITEPVKELELENRLIAKIRAFVLELGKGFSFIGNQYRLEYNHKEYFVDMLNDLESLQSIQYGNLYRCRIVSFIQLRFKRLPFAVRRYFWFLLVGLSGGVCSIHPPSRASLM